MAEEQNRARKAVALLYEQGKTAAPRVVASGTNRVAEKIIATAQEAGVHVTHDPELTELLAKVPLGEEIPEQLYQTVAELLAFVYSVNQQFKEKQEAARRTHPGQNPTIS